MKRKIPLKINDKGKAEWTARGKKDLDNLLLSFAGKDVWISIEKQTNKRTNPQNNYLWGVPYAEIARETGMDTESVHHEMRDMFLKVKGDGPISKVKSTTKLSTTEFIEYVEKIIRWAAEFLGLYIALPNEHELWGNIDGLESLL